ncbi:2-amino-4-hydroxy-6-hydroxymethyldihydropteridine diphosphokinase [Rubrobacter indicoceani]|uniref:2-amino-4-hydroxy-6- hydroxymethyldihydropteridine diphosphokinase n=1 Tax=Rubrobacter indicoceani TaxID=2051957 RepID=UPI0013C52519|nr:2-amino-4-hydroxy-6-hydroxymethyldihydropteridine diphosphokinase [Rubrobacter indicoceani]
MPDPAYLSFGSNLGDRPANLRAALCALGVNEHVRVTRTSKVYETDPVEVGEEHPTYLNCVVEVMCSMPPLELLRYCQGIEAALGRDRKGRMAPRTIDIDILLYGEKTVAGPDLVVPHRGIIRDFNLKCLTDLGDGIPVPGRGTVGNIFAEAESSGVREYATDPFDLR